MPIIPVHVPRSLYPDRYFPYANFGPCCYTPDRCCLDYPTRSSSPKFYPEFPYLYQYSLFEAIVIPRMSGCRSLPLTKREERGKKKTPTGVARRNRGSFRPLFLSNTRVLSTYSRQIQHNEPDSPSKDVWWFVEDVENPMEPCMKAGAVIAEVENSKQFSMKGLCPWVE